MAKDTLHTLAMDLTPTGSGSCVLLDGVDISYLLRGVEVRSTAQGTTDVTLHVARGQRVQVMAMLPESAITLAVDKADGD